MFTSFAIAKVDTNNEEIKAKIDIFFIFFLLFINLILCHIVQLITIINDNDYQYQYVAIRGLL